MHARRTGECALGPAAIKLSVVIAASNGSSMLEPCLSSLRGQGEAPDTEVIVAGNFDGPEKERIQRQFGFVKYLALPAGTPVPDLRTAGLACATGEIVGLLEDHCTVDARWCDEMKQAHRLPYAAIGGAVENRSPMRPLNWAVYFFDYGKYMLPISAGAASSLAGNSVTYKRLILSEVEASYRQGFFEIFVHQELKRRGHLLYLTPAAVVYHRKNYAWGNTLIWMFHLARSFAGKRVSGDSLAKRAAFAGGSLVLPFLLLARIVATVLEKRRHLGELFLSLPALAVLLASWSTGEFCGYAGGEGGSARKWT
jgi:glycosyltransferase involved in cell wall biosynthesis